MQTPNDQELLKFVAEFAGWRDLTEIDSQPPSNLFGLSTTLGYYTHVPDYLNSLDAFQKDVLPKIKSIDGLHVLYASKIPDAQHDSIGKGRWDYLEATAHDRCQALYSALDGKLPGQEKTETVIERIRKDVEAKRSNCRCTELERKNDDLYFNAFKYQQRAEAFGEVLQIIDNATKEGAAA